MNVKPIPNSLLGDKIVLITPTAAGWSEKAINNVRVERGGAVTDPASQKARDVTGITVWFDYKNSSPRSDFPVGAKVRYHGEIFEITEQRIYCAEAPHHCKFKARKIDGAYKEVNS